MIAYLFECHDPCNRRQPISYMLVHANSLGEAQDKINFALQKQKSIKTKLVTLL